MIYAYVGGVGRINDVDVRGWANPWAEASRSRSGRQQPLVGWEYISCMLEQGLPLRISQLEAARVGAGQGRVHVR